ncbi:sugar kinase [Streptomyces tsukubensis]|uniref:Sugar kinase n=1 Tax=Streptomyces tsukubensis TaxID=83656 RepID=A0A1V4ACH8_9ACTN|nr:sugar kinase [Streptomyces tsukubensis]OON81662.1 sugar kinase [Streptomyces tsukubensis]QFR96438.1 sugar kinase [Streptomyces tsukubensis]
MTVPRQPQPPEDGAHPAEGRSRMIRRRTLTLLIIVLLIGVPAGYLLISAAQSRDSGRDKEDKYSATGLTAGWPSKVQRRVYEVPITHYSKFVAYYETNNWKTSRLYVQFQTSNHGLRLFLSRVGTTEAALHNGRITIKDRDKKITGWDFSGPGPFKGLTHEQKDPRPTQDITVDRSDPKRAMVYVVSETTP